MRQYLCQILYAYSEKEALAFILKALKVLGFQPKYMNISFNEFEKSLDDIAFEEEFLFTLLKRKPNTITILNQLYDEDNMENYSWFRFSLSIDTAFTLKTCSLEWSNSSLNFLLSSKEFKTFLDVENLIYCYCYDQLDCMDQSDTSKVNPEFNSPWKFGEHSRDFILTNAKDISEHWGRYVSTRGITFMAAPIMYFGKEFYKIIPKEELIKFKSASLIDHSTFEIVYIVLFDLYDIPSKKGNRISQKEFWKFFDLQKKIAQYEKTHPIDFVKWLKERGTSNKKRKVKK